MSHTKGPWFAEHLNSQTTDIIHIHNGEGKNGEIGSIYKSPFKTEYIDNAKLMAAAPDLLAAAPDLLEACKRMEDFVRRCLTLEDKLSQADIDFICMPATLAIKKAINQPPPGTTSNK